MRYEVKTRKFVVLEMNFDASKGYRAGWSGWTETFDTRREAQAEMSRYVNGKTGIRKGEMEYVRKIDNLGRHDMTTYVVCSPKEAQGIIDVSYLMTGCSSPFWCDLIED